MRKAVLYLCIFLAFILIYFLHSNFFTWFNIAGIQPNMIVILILFCGLFMGKQQGLIWGTVCGIFLSLFIQTDVIIAPIMLGIVGFVSGVISKNFSKESRFNIMVMVIVATFAYELGSYFLKILIFKSTVEIFAFIKIILIEMFFNAMITIIISPIIQYFGQKIEDKLLGMDVLRYY